MHITLAAILLVAVCYESVSATVTCPHMFTTCLDLAKTLRTMAEAPDTDTAAELAQEGHVNAANLIANTCRHHQTMKACGELFKEQCHDQVDRHPRIKAHVDVFRREFVKTDALCESLPGSG